MPLPPDPPPVYKILIWIVVWLCCVLPVYYLIPKYYLPIAMVLFGVVVIFRRRRIRRNRREEIARENANVWIAELDRALQSARKDQAYISGIAFDADTQFANAQSRYDTHYVSPEKARYLSEFLDEGPDEPDPPTVKAGLYVTPVKVSGPALIGTVPETPGFIPHDQLIQFPTWPGSPQAQIRPPGWTPSYCRFCGASRTQSDRYCGACGEQFDNQRI